MKKAMTLVPLCPIEAFEDAYLSGAPKTLGQLLHEAPALSTAPLEPGQLQRPVDEFNIEIRDYPPERELYRPPGLVVGPGATPATEPACDEPDEPAPASAWQPETAERPHVIGDGLATRLAYACEIEKVASFLRTELSVLVFCDKLVVEHLYGEMARCANLRDIVPEVTEERGEGFLPQSMRQRQLAQLKELILALKDGDVLVIPHLDLLAGGGGDNPSAETREVVELLYGAADRLILAFADRSLDIPEVLAGRFAVRVMISGLPRVITYPDGSVKPLGQALVTGQEAKAFQGFDSERLYKNVAGMNPIRLRQAIKYAVKEEAAEGAVPVARLYHAIRAFKAQTTAKFEVPDVSFENIGGYHHVKTRMARVLSLMLGSFKLPDESLQRELIPRGFIFHGPPGTGKTLFAKAIANQLNATIQVVSGPEVTDMYVGESERKVRELFAEARRNAPAVLVFDEFDAIATQRSNRDDGGSRAGNALVAQILTEMDGFRPDVPVLVIGTTKRIDIIDEALLRPSRFQDIKIGLPDRSARHAIARVHAGHFRIQVAEALFELLADATEGFNGDEIRSVFRDACVGLYCEDPPVLADARRLGYLVGQIRDAAENRAGIAARRASPHDGGAPRAADGMILLTPEQATNHEPMEEQP